MALLADYQLLRRFALLFFRARCVVKLERIIIAGRATLAVVFSLCTALVRFVGYLRSSVIRIITASHRLLPPTAFDTLIILPNFLFKFHAYILLSVYRSVSPSRRHRSRSRRAVAIVVV